MTDWTQNTFIGSLRRYVLREIREHIRNNPTLRRARYSMWLRFLRATMAGRSFALFVGWYFVLVAAFVVVDALSFKLAPTLRSTWIPATPEIRIALTNATSYLVGAQVGVLGIVSIAVGLVTLIAQRQDANIDVQIYYRESLAQEVTASCIALLLVLCFQIFWPVQVIVRAAGLSSVSNDFESLATLIHIGWLLVNLSALAHFVNLSLRFVQPLERREIRNKYTANFVIPFDLKELLSNAVYASAAGSLVSGYDAQNGVLIAFGYALGDPEHEEIETTFTKPVVLRDVRMRPLGWVLRRWWKRCNAATVPVGIAGLRGAAVYLVFIPSFNRVLTGRTVWCLRHGGVPLKFIEKLVVRWCFCFQKVDR